MTETSFSAMVLDWYALHGRHDLPWQRPRTAYRVWISEMMLQQTQVSTVIPYFLEFMRQFPSVAILAQAPLQQVLACWSGLGYYRRAHFIHRAAIAMCEYHQGQVPDTLPALMALPGIGRSTAGAILSLAYQQRHSLCDGNVKRLFSRVFCIEEPIDRTQGEKRLWQLADQHLPLQHCDQYNQALMDLGATVCTRSKPQCHQCPLQVRCLAHRHQTTAHYPRKTPSRRQSEHHYLLHIPTRRQEYFLQKRPHDGIWPDLWCFPLEATNSPPDDITPIKHVFSHQIWYLYPVMTTEPTAEGQWFSYQASLQLPLPQPIKKLLLRVCG